MLSITLGCRSQWPSGLGWGYGAARLLGLRVRIPPGAWMFVSFEYFVLWGRGLCFGPIPRPEESYWLWCVIGCDLETSCTRRPWPALGCCTGEREREADYLKMFIRCFISTRKPTISEGHVQCFYFSADIKRHKNKLMNLQMSHWSSFSW